MDGPGREAYYYSSITGSRWYRAPLRGAQFGTPNRAPAPRGPDKWGWAPRASNPGGRRGRDLQPLPCPARTQVPAPPLRPRPAGNSEFESGKQNNSDFIDQAVRGAGGAGELRCAAAAVAGRSGPPLLCLLRTRAVLQTKIATSTVATRRHPNMFPCVHKMLGGAPRLLTRTRQRTHHRSPAVYVRSAVGSRMSKHRALAHPPSAPTICEVVRLPDYVKKLCASTDGHSPFAPRSCLTGATVLAKPTSDAVVALPSRLRAVKGSASPRGSAASPPSRAVLLRRSEGLWWSITPHGQTRQRKHYTIFDLRKPRPVVQPGC
jgi:hypothetical protein